MEGHPDAGHGGDRDLEEPLRIELPPEGDVGPEGVPDGPEQGLALAPLLPGEVRTHEVVEAPDRVEQVGEERGVVDVPHLVELAQGGSGEGVPGAAEAAGLVPGGRGDGLVGPGEVVGELVRLVEVEPG